MGQHKILAITGDQLRHRYFLHRLALRTPVAAAFIESTHYPPAAAGSAQARAAWDWYFARREAYEARRFRHAAVSPGPPLFSIARGKINSPDTLDRISAIGPTLIVVFGTSLLEDRILERFEGRIINLHLGLTQHYRGSSANFWPIHDRRPEALGATVHTVDRGIDTGAVLLRSGIALDPGDDEQTLAGKTLIAGGRLMALAVDLFKAGRLLPRRPRRKGRLRLRKDLTPDSMLSVKRLVESGELRRLIEAANARRRTARHFPRARGGGQDTQNF